LEEDERALGRDEAVLPLRIFRRQHTAGEAALRERLLGALLGLRDQLDQPVQEEQILAGLILELAPRLERLDRPPHPDRVRVRDPEDPRPPV
jgi:hypothetical protein